MHKKIAILFLCCVYNVVTVAQTNIVLSHIPKTGDSAAYFIPKGYKVMATANGDLNKDNLNDIVFVLKDEREDTADMNSDLIDENRILIAVLKTKNGWALAEASDKAVSCKNCGGMMGDPLSDIEISKGVLTVYHSGGSNWRWSNISKFRYQNSNFYLIGKTNDFYCISYNCHKKEEEYGGRDYSDINYVTGDRIRIKTGEDCEVLLNKKDKISIMPLVKMANLEN